MLSVVLGQSLGNYVHILQDNTMLSEFVSLPAEQSCSLGAGGLGLGKLQQMSAGDVWTLTCGCSEMISGLQ